MEGRSGQVEVGIRKTSDQREKDGGAHAEVCEQARIAKLFAGMT